MKNRRTPYLICCVAAAILLALSPESLLAQIRIKIPRPPITAPAAPTKTEPGASERGVGAATTGISQTNKSAIEYESLMTMRFYEETGGFLVETLEVVFPPAGGSAATFVVMKPGGEVVASVPLRY